ncbi:MAG: APC family permease [Gemmatimonadales bacterium]
MDPSPNPQPGQPALLRVLRRRELVALGINTIIGAGIFGLPAEVFKRVGVYSLLAFVVCGLLVSFMVLCFAEVSSRFTGTGGPYLYARAAFGPLAGFEVGWLLWIARLTAFAANCNLFVSYLSFFWPEAGAGILRGVVITAIVAGLTVLNLTGVKNAATASNAFTVAKLLPLLLFIGVGLFFLRPGAYAAAAPPGLGEFSVSVLLLVFAFSGFELATITAGEARDPRGDLPRALLIAMGVVVACYVLVQFVAIGTLPAPALAQSTRPLADAASRFLGAPGGAIISAGALVSIGGNLLVIVLVAPRLLYAMAERGELPRWFGAVHPRFRTPYLATLATSLLLLTLTLTNTFVYAATISVIARLLAYGSTCAALPVLRRKPNAPPAAFRAPAGVVLAIVVLVLTLWLLAQTTARQARDGAIAVLTGLVIYWLGRRKKE